MRKLPLLAVLMLTAIITKGQLKTNTSILQKAQKEVAVQEKNLRESILE